MLEAQPIAALRRRLGAGEVGSAWREALDLVWAFLRRHEGLRGDGHNVFVYHHAARPDQPMQVEFGVQVTRVFEGEGGVVSSQTPAGEYACAIATGYAELSAAHRAVATWCEAHGRGLAGVSIERYGDPDESDPTKIDIEVMHLLR